MKNNILALKEILWLSFVDYYTLIFFKKYFAAINITWNKPKRNKKFNLIIKLNLGIYTSTQVQVR